MGENIAGSGCSCCLRDCRPEDTCQIGARRSSGRGGIRRYVHLGTGNYHPSTAKLYTDLGLLTCDPDLTNDTAELFNWLTGVSVFPNLKKIKAAPKALHDFVLEMIGRETDHAQEGKPRRSLRK